MVSNWDTIQYVCQYCFYFKKKKEKERVQILNFLFSRKIFKKHKRHKDLQYGIEILKQKTVWYNEFANKQDKNHYLHFKLSPAPPDSYLHHTKLIFSTSSLNKIVTWSKNSIIYIYIFVTNCYKIKQWPYTVKKNSHILQHTSQIIFVPNTITTLFIIVDII